MMRNQPRACPHGCADCQGQNAVAQVQQMIETVGTAALFVEDFCYTIGLSGGKAGGIEFYLSGMNPQVANAVILALKDHYARICPAVREGKRLHLVTVQECLRVQGGVLGSLSFLPLEKSLRRERCTMLHRYYGHGDFDVYRVFICDAAGRTPDDPKYDPALLRASNL